GWWMNSSDCFSKNQNCICDLKCLKRDADDPCRFCLKAPPAGNLFEMGIDFTDHTQIINIKKIDTYRSKLNQIDFAPLCIKSARAEEKKNETHNLQIIAACN